jgi:hypothetical protein
MSFLAMMKKPSAFLPVGMSLAALALVLGYVGLFGVPHEADEGTPAHLLQLLVVAQGPIVAFFVIRWFAQSPRQTVQVLALQAGVALAALAPLFFLGL